MFHANALAKLCAVFIFEAVPMYFEQQQLGINKHVSNTSVTICVATELLVQAVSSMVSPYL